MTNAAPTPEEIAELDAVLIQLANGEIASLRYKNGLRDIGKDALAALRWQRDQLAQRVPREPTPEMIKAASVTWKRAEITGRSLKFADLWRAMYDAAQAAPDDALTEEKRAWYLRESQKIIDSIDEAAPDAPRTETEKWEATMREVAPETFRAGGNLSAEPPAAKDAAQVPVLPHRTGSGAMYAAPPEDVAAQDAALVAMLRVLDATQSNTGHGRDYTCSEAAARIEALAADAAELREDAARYRWLSVRCLAADFDYGERHECVLVFRWPVNVGIGGNLNMAIDAVRAKGRA